MKSYEEVRDQYEVCTGLLKMASAITAPLDSGVREMLSKTKEAAIMLGWVLGYKPERIAFDMRPDPQGRGLG